MNKMFFPLLVCLFLFHGSIYEYSIETAQGNTIALNSLQGKKILLVNIATSGERAGQLGALQQLQNLYADSLVVIAFPSNSFGHEPRRDAEIQEYWQTMGFNFIVAKVAPVKGETQQAVYEWLTKASKNGVANSQVAGDFQKYLVNQAGELVGFFSGAVSPLDPQIIQSIQTAQ